MVAPSARDVCMEEWRASEIHYGQNCSLLCSIESSTAV